MAPTTKPPLTLEQAGPRIRRYCAFQERSQQEVRDRLYSWGLHSRETESLIADMMAEGYLKEERFASAFVGGKFRIKKWGKNKIRHALKVKQVSEPLISQALRSIDDHEYRKTLLKVMNERDAKLKEAHPFKRKQLLARYAIQRGYEPELVWQLLGEED
ncbi:MAG: regulatory protein RecX [Bacteroidota bacterium]